MNLVLGTIDAWHRHAVETELPRGRDQVTDAERISLLTQIEDLKNTLSALQGELAVDFDASQRAQQAAAGEPAGRQGRGVAHQLALARRESPHRGGVFLGVAQALHAEMPHTAGALRDGRLSEYQAMLMVRETACLTIENRVEVDELICADPATLDGVGTRQLIGKLRGHAARLDPAAVVRRNRTAESERTVSLRPAPDTMTYLTGLLPVAQGVACLASLQQAVGAAKAGGDERTKGQIMADTLVGRLTGGFRDGAGAPPQPPVTRAGAPPQPPVVPITVNVVISDTALLGGGHEPAHIPGHGPIPTEVARTIVANSLDSDAVTFIRGLYADPNGRLVAMTTKQRFHTEGIAEFLRLRDQGICRTPWCDAPIAQSDHIHTADTGGETNAENGQGLCVACNRAKQAPDWTQATNPTSGRHQVETITPTGHRYRSTAPRAPNPAQSKRSRAWPPEGWVVQVVHREDLILSA